MTVENRVFPVGMVLAGRPCLVVGGGRVAARKIKALVESRAAVTVVAPEAHEAVEVLAADGTILAIEGPPIDLQLRPYRRGEASGYRLVIAATGIPDVDRSVADDAEAAGVWVNCADDPEHCSVLLPALHRDGPVTVAISTGGESPALAVWLRDKVAQLIDGGGELALFLGEARRRLKARGRSTEDVDWRGLLDGGLADLVRERKLDEARKLLDEATGLPH